MSKTKTKKKKKELGVSVQDITAGKMIQAVSAYEQFAKKVIVPRLNITDKVQGHMLAPSQKGSIQNDGPIHTQKADS